MALKEHTILKDFPDMSDRILALKKSNQHFAQLSEQYDALEHSIHRMEAGAENFTDEELDEERKKRLKLKDELYNLLKKAA